MTPRHAQIASIASLASSLLLFSLPALAEPTGDRSQGSRGRPDNEVSPVRGIEQEEGRIRPPRRAAPEDIRSIDGAGNNRFEPEMGSTYQPLRRIAAPAYADGVDAMAGDDRPSPRAVSNALSSQLASHVNDLGATDFLWQWGQFLDHDIDLTDGVDPPEAAPIAVPAGDVWFDPSGTGEATIAFNRSIYAETSAAFDVRDQVNEITSWIDASNVYGSDEERASVLRMRDGSGRLRLNDGLLPANDFGLPNAGGNGEALFIAGDVRANEQVGLTALHTLFVREHNRLAKRIAEREPDLSGENVYQRARRVVSALMQSITYREFLPALLGRDALPPYAGYDPDVDAAIRNEFSTAAYRFGHSALSPTLLRIDADGNEIAAGHLALRDAFFRPDVIREEGIAPILRGLASQACQVIDLRVIDDVRNFLFGPPGAGGFDLAALNIQRGRDHGLASYNETRVALGLSPARNFADVTDDPALRDQLAAVYRDVDRIDLWVGGLAEPRLPGSHLGELFHRIVALQFTALRDGDRFWYERDLPPDALDEVRRTRLADVIRRNTAIGDELPDDVFQVFAASAPDGGPAPRRARRGAEPGRP